MRVCKRRKHTTMLTADELERFARHILLHEVGGPGQTALKEASVLVIGAGGLGAPVLMYLAAAGVGTLGAVDDDIVSLSNLQRQIIHTTPDIGRRKVDSAAEVIHALNPHVHFEAHAVRLDAKNVMSLIGGYDLVLVGRLVMVDARAMRFETLRYGRDPQNPLNGDSPVITDLSGHAA